MEQEGRSFADVLKEAQAQGYAEADPTFDIGGFDTAHKLALLTSLAFGTRTSFEAVYVEGIETITPADIEAAGDLGYRIKLLGVALRTESGIEQRVHPTMVPKHTAIAEVDGVSNCVAIDGDFVGDVMLIGPGAGGGPIAFDANVKEEHKIDIESMAPEEREQLRTLLLAAVGKGPITDVEPGED